MKFFSQHGQDRFLLEHFFRGKRGGRFLEVGDTDAGFSNTRFFETSMDWRGVRIARGESNNLPDSLATPNEVDYLGIGLGAAEVLDRADFARPRIAVVSIADASPAIAGLMAQKGYDHVAKVGRDDIFKRHDVKRLPQVSVICAVWHGDPQRLELLKGHAENLARQTALVEPIYVFDGGDDIPASLTARAIAVREDLTIFQAWNAALSLVATPLVMNLNLDDRLAPDAVQVLEEQLSRAGAVIAGGDWKVCYSQPETDNVEPCYPAERVPIIPERQPKLGSSGRLECGTQNSGSLGPASMWRMEAHMGVPRYPWRFAEGTLIRSAADLAWWRALATAVGGKVVRVPMIIGNYHSHPSDQAGSRKPPYDEVAMMNDVGIARI